MDDMQLVLASASPRRRELLALTGIPFVIDAPEVDRYLAEGVATTDQETRAVAYKAMQKLLSQDLPILPLCEAVITEVAQSYLSDLPLSTPGLGSVGDLSHAKINK